MAAAADPAAAAEGPAPAPRVALLVKQVPDVADLRLDPVTRTLVRDGVPSILNPYDRTALAMALELGAEVVAVSMGPPAAVDILRECLAGGCSRAVLLTDRALAGSDTLVTATAIARALRELGPFDVVVGGQRATDAETGQVPPEVAALLGIPSVMGVRELTVGESLLTAVREVEAGRERVRSPLPALVGVVEGAVKAPRIRPAEFLATPPERVEVWDADRLGIERAQLGLAGSPTVVRDVRPLATERAGRILGGVEAVPELVELLRLEGAFGLAAGGGELAPPPRRAAGTGGVVVVAERTADGALHPAVAEMVGLAQGVASATRRHVEALGTSDVARELGALGADVVLRGGEGEAAVVAAIAERRPSVVIAAATPRAREWMPRVAARLRLGMVGDGIGAEVTEDGEPLILKPAFGGLVVAPIASRTSPLLATIRPGTLPPLRADPRRRVPELTIDAAGAAPEPVEVLERMRDADGAVLAGARGTVVCAGYGVGGAEGVEELRSFAGEIGGVLAGTRRVVDAGWLPRSRQIGISGEATPARLYLGFGVRIAPNHLAGLRRVGTVVLVNSDPAAKGFAAADYGIEADWREALEALRAELRGSA